MRKKGSEMPGAATEVVLTSYPNGAKREVEYYLNGGLVGFRLWYENGQIDFERTYQGGKMHGPERMWHENGKLHHETRYVHGKEHGLARQWNEDGELVCSYDMDHGTGVDLWWALGTLSEERHYRDGCLDGYERWWKQDGASVWQEHHFKQNQPHGIWREWNNAGRLRRGFPQYYVAGKLVTKRRYIQACRSDPTLPPFKSEENNPLRAMSKTIRERFCKQLGEGCVGKAS